MSTEDGYGLVETGYKTKLFPDLVKDLENTLSNSFGAINLVAPSVFSVIINAFAVELSKLDLKAEEIYNAFSPNTATGYSLDSIAAYNGISRLASTYSTVLCQVVATPYTLIPSGSEAAVENSNDIIVFNDNLVITNENCQEVSIAIIDNIEGKNYSIILSNISFTYTAQFLDTTADIALGLLGELESGAGSLQYDITVTLDGSILNIATEEYLQIFSCFISDSDLMKIESCKKNVNLKAKELGKIEIPAKSVNVIRTPVDGWISISNLNAGITGRELETDIALRARRSASIKISGSGTMDAIKSRVLNITGVAAVSIFENVTDAVVDSRPPHSFELLALGGDDQAIANMIWLAKPAGIQTYGNTTKTVVDSSGFTHSINFSRSTKLYIFVKVTLVTITDVYNPDSTMVIKQNITNHINSIGLGQDVIYQSLFSNVYSEDGITSAIIEIGGSLNELSPPVKSAANIVIPASQIAITDIAKIEVVVS